MHIQISRRWLVLGATAIVAAVPLAGCESPPDLLPAGGTFSYTYSSGYSSGTFQASGPITGFNSTGFPIGNYAAAMPGFSGTDLELRGRSSAGSAVILLETAEMGDHEIRSYCEGEARCAVVVSDLGDSDSPNRMRLSLASGTVRITALTDGEVRGEFTGTGAITLGGSRQPLGERYNVQISGAFHLPIYQWSAPAASRR